MVKSLSNIRGDILGGVTTAVVALPLALAFGVASGAGAISGLYGAIFVGFFAALFGGTPSQVSGPTGPMTVVITAIIIEYTSKYPGSGLAISFSIVILGGVFQICLGLLKFGRYINLVPYPVISGFMTGIGAIIILLEIPHLLGHGAQGSPLSSLLAVPSILSNINQPAFIIGLITLGIVCLTPAKIARIIPPPILALILCTVLAGMKFFQVAKIPQIGDIPVGLPKMHIPYIEWSALAAIIKSALTLAILGSLDSLLTSLVADNMTRNPHDSNKELVGQGIGNIISGLFWGLPGAGATMRTVVNIRSGGKTPLSGMVHALVLLAVVLGLGGYAEKIPQAVLAGILLKVGFDIIDWKFIKRIHKVPLSISLLTTAVFLVTVCVDLITAVALGIVAASVITVKKLADLQLASIKEVDLADDEFEAPLNSEEKQIFKLIKDSIVMYHLTGPLSFGAAKDMVHRILQLESSKILILDFSSVTLIDITTALAVEDIIKESLQKHNQVMFIGANSQVLDIINKLEILKMLSKENIHSSRLAALKHAKNIVSNIVIY